MVISTLARAKHHVRKYSSRFIFPSSSLSLQQQQQQQPPTSCPAHLTPAPPTPSAMVDLFLERVLVKNNRQRDELDTEPELLGRLQNRILLLFFGSAACSACRGFAPTLASFFRQLTDESYVERSAQLVLLYVR